MQKGFELLKEYLVNPVHSSLYDIGATPSYFMNHFHDIFEDEEIYDKYGLIDRCFCCLGDDIRIACVKMNEIVSFLKNETSYSYEERMNISNDIITLMENYDVHDEVDIYYCNNCKRIIAIYEIPYVFYFSVLEKLLYEQSTIMEAEGTIGRNNWEDVRMCPRCRSHNIKHKEVYYDESGEVEFECCCGDCNYKIGYFAYGSAEYPQPAQSAIFTRIFEQNDFKCKTDLEWDKDELPFN